MIELVLAICLAGEPDICAERLLPQAAPVDQRQCEATADERIADWETRHPEFVIKAWRCTSPSVPALAVTQIAEGVWVHKGRHEIPTPENAGDIANIGFVVGDKAVAVIDAGGSRDVAEQLLIALRGVTDRPVKWLVLTHMHPDHVMGASLFLDMGVRIVGHGNLPASLASRADTYEENYGRLIGPDRMLLSNVIPIQSIKTGIGRLHLGGRELELLPSPTAHTDNDLRVMDSKTNTLWTGDLVFAEHVPALDGSVVGWLGLLDEMALLQADRAVPGHGPISVSWPEGMEPNRKYLQTIVEETREALQRGESLSQAITHVGKTQRGKWLLFDEFNARNATAAYTELEWE